MRKFVENRSKRCLLCEKLKPMHTRDLQNIHGKHILCKNHACISNCFCPKINLHLNSSFLWMFWSTLTIILQVKEGAKYGGTQKLVPQREVQGVQLAPPEGFVTSNLYRLAAGQGIYYPPCIGQGPCWEPASKRTNCQVRVGIQYQPAHGYYVCLWHPSHLLPVQVTHQARSGKRKIKPFREEKRENMDEGCF